MTAARTIVVALIATMILSACASSKDAKKTWNAGDTVICQHCGRDYQLREKITP